MLSSRDDKSLLLAATYKKYMPEMNNIFVHANYVTKNYYDLA
jgi:hypothetical protein